MVLLLVHEDVASSSQFAVGTLGAVGGRTGLSQNVVEGASGVSVLKDGVVRDVAESERCDAEQSIPPNRDSDVTERSGYCDDTSGGIDRA